MSVESAKAFLERVKIDEGLKKNLEAVDSEEEFFTMVSHARFDFSCGEWVSILPGGHDGGLCSTHWEKCTSWTYLGAECSFLLKPGTFQLRESLLTCRVCSEA